MPNPCHVAAMAFRTAGLCALPAKLAEKRPAVGQWRRYRSQMPTETELDAWFANGPDAVCILCGAVSGHAEMIDFDVGAERFDAWAARVPADLLARLVVEKTQHGGRHVFYRCEAEVCGNMKLAQRREAGRTITLIETRGEGGLFLCAPSPGYEVLQGDLRAPPRLTEAERDALLQAAWDLNEHVPEPLGASAARVVMPATSRPGDDFNRRGDVRALLTQAGWSLAKAGENEYWRRPGKASGWSASLKDGVLYVFSANAAPFEPSRAYSPFAVCAMLVHAGDYEKAARALRLEGYGDAAPEADISALLGQAPIVVESVPDEPPAPKIPDPGPMPEAMLRMPGFVGEVMDHCLETAPYPNPVMAFAGALALQAFLAGRKIRDPGDNRTNIYLLGLAHSSAGKDWPRKINTRIAHEVGLAGGLGERFASGEGIQDALFQTPGMLFQTDEIDGMLQSINKSRDARHEAIMSTLLTMYSSSSSIYPMRRKAGRDSPGVINQPSLVVFGTAIPNHYYEALSERMLTNGFFARMIILESGQRGAGQEPSIRAMPPSILATAKWWADFRPGTGNLENWNPAPVVVEQSPEARRLLVETRLEAEAEYALAESRADAVGTTVWGRVSEQTRKLALLHAASENHLRPRIGLAAVQWASAFAMHQTRRMLFMAAGHVAENPFHAECLKAVEKLRAAPGATMPHSALLKRMKMDARSFQELVTTLVEQGDVAIVQSPQSGHGGRPTLAYRLTGQPGGGA